MIKMFLNILLLIQFLNYSTTQDLNGSVMINNVEQKAICECGRNKLSLLNKQVKNVTMCDPRRTDVLEIRKSHKEELISIEIINELMTKQVPEQVPAVNKSLKCLDGRVSAKTGVFGFPGGDFGIFILILSTQEQELNKELSVSELKRIFLTQLKIMPHEFFQMCTDEKAIEYYQRLTGFEGIDIENPRETQIDELIKHIDNYLVHGDVLIKALLKQNIKMQIRHKLVTEFLYVFFNVLWRPSWTQEQDSAEQIKLWDMKLIKDKILFETLVGPHVERAQIEVSSGKQCDDAGVQALLKNTQEQKGESQNFVVNSTQAAFRKIEYISNFLKDQSRNDIDVAKLIRSSKRQAIDWIQLVSHYTSKDLPVQKLLLL